MTDIGQPVRKQSSESSAEVIFGVKSPLDSEDGFCTGCQSVLLRAPITKMIFLNQDSIIILCLTLSSGCRHADIHPKRVSHNK